MKLSVTDRSKIDFADDQIFYQQPRYVHHLSDSFRSRLKELYLNYLHKHYVILDLMSSWVSHLPEEIKFKKVIGHGMNEAELSSNKRLDRFWIQNLNQNRKSCHGVSILFKKMAFFFFSSFWSWPKGILKRARERSPNLFNFFKT